MEWPGSVYQHPPPFVPSDTDYNANTEKQLYPEVNEYYERNTETPLRDEPLTVAVASGSSFWDKDGYKRTVKRIDDGAKLCDELMKLVSERAEIEALYMNRLKAWSKKWNDAITKSTEYGTGETALKSMTTEAELTADIHNQMYNRLLSQVHESVSTWKKSNYHKSMMSWKETKVIAEGFSKGQQPWAKRLDDVNKSKKAYYAAHVSHNQAKQAEADAKLPEKVTTEEQLRKIQDKVAKTEVDVTKTRGKYQENLRDITNYNPKFEEDMKYWFGKAQAFEQERKEFVKQALVQYHAVVEQGQFAGSFSVIGSNLLESFNKIDSAQDLDWCARSYGASMPIHWPQFEEYNPDVLNTSNSTPRKDNNKSTPKESTIITSESETTKPNSTKKWYLHYALNVGWSALYKRRSAEELTIM